jgi:hypothetical protein
MERVKIVIRYADGKLTKGFTSDFFPNKPLFHVQSIDSQPMDKGVEVHVKDLKAVFFVKDFAGNKDYNEHKRFAEGQQPSGRKVEVTFTDGEVIVGSTLGYEPSRPGFFVTPADPKSNNLRIFIITARVLNFRYL